MTKAKRGQSSERSMSEMTLDVKNFGPIAKGRVELRPLTVFAGPSNTGKSWLATLVYVMGRHLREIPMSHKLDDFLEKRSPHHRINSERKSNEDMFSFPENPGRWRKGLKDHGQVRLTETETETIRRILKSLDNVLSDELLRCYGVSRLSDLVRQNHRGKADISVRSGQIGHHLNLRSRTSKEALSIDIAELVLPYVIGGVNRRSSMVLRGYIAEIDAVSKDKDRGDNWGFLRYSMSRVMRTILQNLFPHQEYSDIHYLPADRGGVMHAHSVVVGALISNASRAGLRRETPLPVLSGVLGDFLEQLLWIAEHGARGRSRRIFPKKSHNRSWNDLNRNLEDKILRGAVEVEQSETGYPRFVYRPKGWQRSLPLMNVSSMISEVTPVALYLKHLVYSGDLLIIEEPEAHLHPSMQRQFIEAIASFVKAGLQVLLTTHSEWVLEELANIVARGESERKMENGDVGLEPEDVGVWLFDFKEKNKPELGAFIKEARWEPDEGGYMAGYDEVAMALHNEWASLMRGAS